MAQLVTYLEHLQNDVKRKNSDVRQSIERALAEAAKIDKLIVVSSNKDILTLLCFPFLLALSSNNSKLITSSLSCFPTLISSHTLPESLAFDLLQAIYKNNVGSLSMDCKLKVLQIVPGLMLSYDIHNQQLLVLVDIISSLMNSGNPALSNTASAALQQVFTSLFDGLSNASTDDSMKTEELKYFQDTHSEKQNLIKVSPLDLQCYAVFLDLSLIVAGESPEYFDPNVLITLQMALEIIENVISINRDTVKYHPELLAVLKTKTVPAILEIIQSPPFTFPLTIRALRIAHLIISSQLSTLVSECEELLTCANTILFDSFDTDENTSSSSILAPSLHLLYPFWMRVTVLEMYKALFTNFSVIRPIYENFDKNPSQSNAINDVFVVMNNFLQTTNPNFFNTNFMKTAVPDDTGGQYLCKQTSSLKISLLDHLDKQDPPSTVPSLYPANVVYKLLVNFCEGISEFVSNLSANSAAENIEADVEFITSFNEELFPQLIQLFKKYIFCHLDNDYFSMMIRSLQKYTHAVGLLGIVPLRDSLLVLLSDCIIKSNITEQDSFRNKSSASNLLSIGESIVESISSTIQAPLSPSYPQLSQFESSRSLRSSLSDDKLQGPIFASRRFTTRQVTCFRALTNLAISLGLTLQDSWKIILVTLQWVDYFLRGPDEYSGLANNKDLRKIPEPRLSQTDILIVETSQAKLIDSIQNYQASSFSGLIDVLTDLYPAKDKPKVDAMPNCPYNDTFFVRFLTVVLKVNPSLIILQDNDIWEHVTDYFTALSCDRSAPHNVRQFYITSFNDVIVTITNEGFASDEDNFKETTSRKALNAFIKFLDRLFELGKPNELLVLNCETELQLTVLSTLRNLIDEFDKYFQSSWELVFYILNSAFQTTEINTGDKKLFEKRRLLVSTSFDTLKLILDEFLSSLPARQLKTLIDTLFNFCCQQYDLNISFTSVSYFWLISDTVRSSTESLETNSKERGVHDLQSLEKELKHSPEDSATFYVRLNVYLLAKLSGLSTDQRPQVREGATQTLFQILDTHGKQLSSWDMIYEIVLPEVLNIDLWREGSSLEKRQDVVGSLNIVLSGLVAVINKFMLDFLLSSEKNSQYKFWLRALVFFNDCLSLKWPTLDIKVFQSFQDLIMPLAKKTSEVPKKIADLAFKFWTGVQVEYDFLNPDYQDSLAIFILAFKLLHPVIEHDMTTNDAKSVLSTLNKCARYPALKQNLNDETKLTSLQGSVIEGLKLLLQKDDNGSIISMTLQHLCLILSYPFETRAQIESKLKRFDGKLKIPTFAAVSGEALRIMKNEIEQLNSFDILLADSGLVNLMNGLIGAIRNKIRGRRENEKPLWISCSELLTFMVNRLIEKHYKQIESKREVWEQLRSAIFVCFEKASSEEEGQISKQFNSLSSEVLPRLFKSGKDKKDLIEDIVSKIYKHSFLFEQNLIEKEMANSNTTIDSLIDTYTQFSFEEGFGTTSPIELLENREIRIRCLEIVFEMAGSDDESSVPARNYAIARALFSLRRIIEISRITYKKPPPRIYEEELGIVLRGLLYVQRRTDFGKSPEFHRIFAILPKIIHFANLISGAPELVEKLCCEEMVR